MTDHPFTTLLVFLNLCNVVWYSTKGHWGLVIYWLAAAAITTSATWLRGWGVE